jgi:uncharacterized membrane protein
MSVLVLITLQIVVLAYALIAGVFLAFSDFIMRALMLTSGTGGAEAMQVINREVFRWVFMLLFIGLAPVSIGIAVYGVFWVGNGPGALFALAGILYLFGCFLVTVVFNVPMNEALAEMELSDPATHAYWLDSYVPRWTFWNSIRATASAIASVAMMSGLIWISRGG